MKESTLVMMQKDIKILQQALAVALYKIEKLEKEKDDNRGENKESSGVQDLDSKKKS